MTELNKMEKEGRIHSAVTDALIIIADKVEKIKYIYVRWDREKEKYDIYERLEQYTNDIEDSVIELKKAFKNDQNIS